MPELSTVGPSVSMESVRLFEECAFNAWPAQRTATCNGWVLRLSEGYTKRANSANAWRPSGSFEQTRALAEAFYARHGQPAIFRISPLAGDAADLQLAAAGYVRSGETLVLCAPLLAAETRHATAGTAPGGAAVSATADAAWRRGYAEAAEVPEAARRLHARLLDNIAMPCGFLSVDAAGGSGPPVGFGMGVVERGQLGLFDIVVHPDARRRGAARRLMAGLLQWGRSQGAHQAYLQVVADNAAAIALYRSLGFREAYRYHYRIRDAQSD